VDVKSYKLSKNYTNQEVTRIVNRETDTDAMSRQAAVDAHGVDKVNLKTRLDDDYNKVTSQLAQIAYAPPINTYANVADGINSFYQSLPEGSILKLPKGEIEIDRPLIFDRRLNLDFIGSQLSYLGDENFPAVTIGKETGAVWEIDVKGLRVSRKNEVNRRTNPNEIGIRIINVKYSKIEFSSFYFYNLVVIDAMNSTGNVYNHYTIGWLYDGFNALIIRTSDATGWANENNFYGGSLAISSSASTSDKTLLKVEHNGYRNNNNRFYGCAFEDAGFMAYAIDCDGGSHYFYGCRYEGASKVIFRSNSLDNKIMNGFGVDQLEIVDEGGNNSFIGNRGQHLKVSTGFIIEERNSVNNKTLSVRYNGIDYFSVAGNGDVKARTINSNYGYSFGDGSISILTGTGIPTNKKSAGSLYMDKNGDYTSLYYKRYGTDSAGWENIQTIAQGETRPTISVVGFCWFDVTLGKPIWWNGTSWVDSTGTVV
jgi:hypothetical protein